ncbi:hypothetical protein [Rhodopila sp.]|uniref:hypothetical protein n=1 Tax=Rhodopila sp. TaxID=2480087 RepID=UPI003D0D5A69
MIGFLSMQMFALIYLQKLALFPQSFPLSIPMLIMFGSIAYMVVMRKMQVSPERLGFYIVFVSVVVLATSLSGGSYASLIDLVVLYGCWTVQARTSSLAYRVISDRFIWLMIVPAVVTIVQYIYQKLTGLSNPIDMTYFVPQSLLMKGFVYIAHHPWYSSFIRPNGFFFLEPSFLSAFTATATIIEIVYFRRWYFVGLMVAATLMSTGGTGMLMFLLAAPFLLAREKPWLIIAVIGAAIVGILLALTMDISLPLISRMGEMQHRDSSGGARLVVPATQFMEHFFDPTYLFYGAGPGSTVNEVDGPIVKVLNEYGVLAVLAYVLLYTVFVWRTPNRSLKFSLSVIFLFTGGYLLNPIMIEMLYVLFFAAQPRRTD